ncbi:MAG: magnesium transporter [Myxococcota bacterium]|jgi:magnesium transporter|nr:magnesium transporter [Myxococcota bacterium]
MAVNLTQIELLRKLLRHGATDRVVRITEKLRPTEIAEVFGYLSPAEQRQFVDILFKHGDAASTLLEIPDGILTQMLPSFRDERVGALLADMAPDDAYYIIGLLDEDRVDPILARLPKAQRERVEHMRNYPLESAGSLMTSQMVTLTESLTAAEAIALIREHVEESEFIFYIYVVNDVKTFLGVVPIRRLLVAKPDRPISELMVANPIAVFATDDQEEVASVTARYNLLAVPVVDANFRLLGVITVDDVIDVLRDEATEDMYLMQGLSDEDRVYSPVSQSVRKRFPWMVFNLFTAFAAASVIGLFESSIAQVVVLATFMPVVAGMGGNGGTQTLTVVTRAIAIGELSFAEGKVAVSKQATIGVINGAGIGLLTGLVAWLWKGNFYLGAVLFLAMLLNLAIAGLVGAAVPLVLKALNLDPALGGGVIVTTFTDVCGFMAFLGLATLFLPYLA